MKSLMTKLLVMLTAISVMTMFASQAEAKPRRMKALVVSGQNNHNWPVSHKVLKLILEQSGLFDVDIALTAPAGGDMSNFKPDFAAYDVVVLDYNGDRWPAETDAAFLDYVALGGWEGRNEKSGPYCYLKDGKLVLDHSAGPGGSHGAQREYVMHGRDTKHPVTKGLPVNWMHAQDEMYDRMRGPANIGDLLYSGMTDPATGGSGREEPLVFTVDYGRARIFHLMLGHCGPTAEDNPAMQCAGFQTLLLRGAEWAATGKVKQPVPKDFPTATKVSLRRDYRAPEK